MCRQGAADAQSVQPRIHGTSQVREVWSSNFLDELEWLLAASAASGPGAILAFDIMLPGELDVGLAPGADPGSHRALRRSVTLLRPLQLGIALGGDEGMPPEVWNFNLQFDAAVDLYTEAALTSLARAGVNFQRHAAQGIDAAQLGAHLRTSPLVGGNPDAPWWVTLKGTSNMGQLFKLVTGQPLPSDDSTFHDGLAAHFPQRTELMGCTSDARHGADRQGRWAVPCAGCSALDLFNQYSQRRHRACAWLNGIAAVPTASRQGQDSEELPESSGQQSPELRAASPGSWAGAARRAMAVQP
mmetsp:Transcript_79456/g.233526  ORF Transcript_79456/g.233526 Transcript_79456/m.233526 type:complete len:300 (+) Transcript_79456:121-1020(+)